MKEYKVIKEYVDKELNKNMNINTTLELAPERAKTLLELKLIEEVVKK